MHTDAACALQCDVRQPQDNAWFNVRIGFKQGDVNALMLFNIFLDTICRLIEPLPNHLGLNVGYEIDGHLASCRLQQYHRQYWVLYADDIVILTDSQEKMQAALEIIDQFFSGWGVEINIQKTKWMRLGAANFSRATL
jgi:hypothetical protein